MSDAIHMPADTSTTVRGGAAAADSGMEAVGEWLRHLRVTSTARHRMHKDGLYCGTPAPFPSFGNISRVSVLGKQFLRALSHSES